MIKFLESPFLYNLVQYAFGSNNSRKKFIEDYLPLQKSDKLLDLGCGTADILKFLPNIDYTGIDASPRYIEKARKSFPKSGNFICSNFDENSKFEGEYDYVIALGLIHHLNEVTSEKIIKNAYRVPKKREN